MIFISTVSIAFAFIGPSKTIGLPQELYLMCIGLALLGFTAGCALIPLYPELIEYSKQTFGDCPENNEKITGLYATAFSVGHIAGPYLGAQLTASFDFNTTCDVLALACFTLSIFYFLLGKGFSACKILKPVPPPTQQPKTVPEKQIKS